jgi:hypothetical protein
MTARQAASASVVIRSARSVCQASAKPETPEQVANRLLLCDITPGYGAAGDRDARATLSRLRRSSVRGVKHKLGRDQGIELRAYLVKTVGVARCLVA